MNLPNKITLFRIIMLPVFLATGILALYGIPYMYFVSIALFVIAAVSDYFDGHIARKYNLVTNLGKFMDPIADKLLCTTGLLKNNSFAMHLGVSELIQLKGIEKVLICKEHDDPKSRSHPP